MSKDEKIVSDILTMLDQVPVEEQRRIRTGLEWYLDAKKYCEASSRQQAGHAPEASA